MKKRTIGILSSLVGAIIGLVGVIIICESITDKKVHQIEKKVDKFKTYYEVLNEWLILKQENKKINSYFENAGYKNIAIYGMGELGNRLRKELELSEINVLYCMDSETACFDADSKVIDMDNRLEGIDAIIVTAMFAFDEIEEELTKKYSYPIISLEEVIFTI